MKPCISLLALLALAAPALSQTTRPTTQPSRDSANPDLMLQQLLSGNRPKPPLDPVEFPPEKTVDLLTTKPSTPRGQQPTLIREGTYLPDRIGRLTKTPEGQWELTLESDGLAMKDPPLLLLPNQKLMDMETRLRNTSRDLRFRVTGMVTEYNNRNYILLDKWVAVDTGIPGLNTARKGDKDQ